MRGLKRKIVTGCGNTHLTAFFNEEGKLQECFYSRGSAGGCESSYTAISRLVSLACREGIPAEKVIDQLKSVQPCPAYRVRTATKGDTSKGTACASAMAFALEEMIKEFNESTALKPKNSDVILCDGHVKKSNLFPCVTASIKPQEDITTTEGPKCPDCGAPLVHEGGCDVCKFCGWSRCG
jgi:ribonucleoside-diphosphate reductase alpha chain